jgi:hypothetical protein
VGRPRNSRAPAYRPDALPVQQALVYWDIPPSLGGPPRSLAELATVNRRVGHLRMQAGYTELGALLPSLIKELTVHAHQGGQKDRERAFRLLTDAYTAVDSMAYKLGYMDLFALAVERMAWAASHSDDPLLRPVAAMRRTAPDATWATANRVIPPRSASWALSTCAPP